MRRLLRVVALVTAFLIFIGIGVLASFYQGDIPVVELEKIYADEASQFVETNGIRLHYKDEGPRDAPVLVLLHGFAASLHTWDGWAAELVGDYRMVRLDLPGHGLTGPRPDNDYSSTAAVELLAAFLDHLGVERFHLGGNSMGGGISWRFATIHPERVDRLILVDAGGAPPAQGATADSQRPQRQGGSSVMRLIRRPVIRDLAPRLTPRFLYERGLLEVYGDDSKVTDELVDRYFQLSLRSGNRPALMRRLQQAGPPPPYDLIPLIESPTLILWGEDDIWLPVSGGRRFDALMPNSELIVYPGVGHVPMEEIPEQTARDVRAFLAAASDAPSA